MKKSIVVCGALFYSSWALQVPERSFDVEIFKKRVNELQHFLFKVRGQLLGLDLSLAVGFAERESTHWSILREVASTSAASIDLTTIVQSIDTQVTVARNLQAATHGEWHELPEYTVLIGVIEQLNLMARILKDKQDRLHMNGHINPFK